jgi:hypothetical protein
MRNPVVLLLLLLLFSCSGEKQITIPDTVLSQERMADIMTDIHLLEASMNLNISKGLVIGNNRGLGATTLAILKQKGVTKEQYETSFRFYTEHPALLNDVYQLVLNNLSKLQAKVANEKDTTSIKKDSLKRP